MYFVENNKLYNNNRIKLNRHEIFNNTIEMFYMLYKKINVNKVIYLHYYLIEIDCQEFDNTFEKYFIICKNYSDMNNLKNDFDKYLKGGVNHD